jgi:hypothetical protein
LYSFSTCCGQVESHTPLIRFVKDLLLRPQQIHNISTCRDVVDLSKSRKVVDLMWICRTTCSTNPQQIEQVESECKDLT